MERLEMKTPAPLKHIEEKIRKQRMMMKEKKEEKEDEQEIVS